MHIQKIIDKLNVVSKNTLMETLGIVYTNVGDDYLEAEMPVHSKLYQPNGVLHGGAMVALAESVGSAAAIVFAQDENIQIRGVQISANHVKSISSGKLIARATKKHFGKTTQVWDIDLRNEMHELISTVVLTTIRLGHAK